MNRVKTWYIIGSLAVLITLATGYGLLRPPQWQRTLGAAMVKENASTAKGFPPSVWRSRQSIMNDVLQRAEWGESEFREIASFYATPIDFDRVYGQRELRTVEEAGKAMLRSNAQDAITLRLSSGAPIATSVRNRFEALLLDDLNHPQPSIRLGATTSVVIAGLAEPGMPGRAAIEHLFNDPDPTVAKNARNQLEWRDKDRQRAGR